MVHLLHADKFFPGQEAENLRHLVKNLSMVKRPYGYEVDNFNLIFPDIEIILHKVLGERVTVDPARSGVVRMPINDAVWFENFDSTEEWCFVVALEPTVVNFYHHTDPNLQMGDLAPANAQNALQGVDYDFNNLFEWKIHTNILLDTNQCLFFRPWVFHNMDRGLIQYYRLLADTKFRILVMGMPGSCRASVAQALADRLPDSKILRSIDLRHRARDIDFTEPGQLRHCYRMLSHARSSPAPITIIDMACPLAKMRQILNADVVIWCSDQTQCQYDELNAMFEWPVQFDVECQDSSDTSIEMIGRRIATMRL